MPDLDPLHLLLTFPLLVFGLRVLHLISWQSSQSVRSPIRYILLLLVPIVLVPLVLDLLASKPPIDSTVRSFTLPVSPLPLLYPLPFPLDLLASKPPIDSTVRSFTLPVSPLPLLYPLPFPLDLLAKQAVH